VKSLFGLIDDCIKELCEEKLDLPTAVGIA